MKSEATWNDMEAHGIKGITYRTFDKVYGVKLRNK
jgi:hypothetical protein